MHIEELGEIISPPPGPISSNSLNGSDSGVSITLKVLIRPSELATRGLHGVACVDHISPGEGGLAPVSHNLRVAGSAEITFNCLFTPDIGSNDSR